MKEHSFETYSQECKSEKIWEARHRNLKNRGMSLGDVYPEISSEWHPSKNGDKTPYDYAPVSQKKVWWLGKCGHEWQALILNRTRRNDRCPYCTNRRILVGFNDIATTHPELLKEWDYEENEFLPTELSFGTSKRISWKCNKGHKWKACVSNRLRGSNCPYCGNKKVFVGFNDLATTHPWLIKEWNSEKNDLKPTEVLASSNAIVSWKCEYGHEWKTKIIYRAGGTGCPRCTKYKQTSFMEQAIIYYLSKAFDDVINSYKELGYELDIYIPSKNVAIEYDGRRWHQDEDRDYRKNEKCKADGISLIRIREKGCPELVDDCIYILMQDNSERMFINALQELLQMLGVEGVDIDLDRDRNSIYELYVNSVADRSLSYRFPEIAKEWHPEKNGTVTPNMVFASTSKEFWWKCAEGHEWQGSPNARTSAGMGCPYCSGSIICEGFNDIATTNPEIMRYWNYNMNHIKPTEIGISYQKKIWWICDNGHEWEDYTTAVSKNERPCPICRKRLLLTGYNDFATLNPELMEEWNYQRNTVDPTKILAGSQIKVWWTCKECGHEWQALTLNRKPGKRKNTGCPVCAESRRRDTKMDKIRNSGESFADKYPELLNDWDYDKNSDISPFDYGFRSRQRVWWKCKAGHEWQTTIVTRSQGSGCPTCAKLNAGAQSRRKVINIDTGEVFDSVSKAAERYKCTNGCITLACSGKNKTAKKFHWKYYGE